VAFVIAAPIAWYGAGEWLKSFAYRTDLSWWIFAITGVLALLVALLTVSFQSLRAALANPVRSLRSE
jgi:putative ABC transport system permease protein